MNVRRLKLGRVDAYVFRSPFGAQWASDAKGNMVIVVGPEMKAFLINVLVATVWMVIVYAVLDFDKSTIRHCCCASFALVGLLFALVAAFTDPGILPSPSESSRRVVGGVGIPIAPAQNPWLERRVNLKRNAGVRASDSNLVACAPCGHYRPKDGKHCTICDVCVLDHDHHCGIAGICLGHRNVTYFFLTELFGGMSAFILAVLIGLPLLFDLVYTKGDFTIATAASAAVIGISGLVAMLLLGFLFLQTVEHFCHEDTRVHLPPSSTAWDAIRHAQWYWWCHSFPSLIGYYADDIEV